MNSRPRRRTKTNSESSVSKDGTMSKKEDKVEGQSAFPSILPLNQIIPSSIQPRRYFNPDKLEKLMQSVKTHGILEPVIVRPLAENQYELVAGERRYRAAMAAGFRDIPVIVKEINNTEVLEIALIENLQREDLNPVEETEGILQLLSIKLGMETKEVLSLLYRMQNLTAGKITDNVISNSLKEIIEVVFTEIGRMNWQSFTANRLPLLRLSEDVLSALHQGKIEYTKAKAIDRIKDKKARSKLLQESISQSLSLNQIRQQIRDLQSSEQQEPLRSRFDKTYKKAKNANLLWSNPKKRKQLESLLTKLEQLIEQESSD